MGKTLHRSFHAIAVAALFLLAFTVEAAAGPGVRGGRVACADGTHKRIVSITSSLAESDQNVYYSYENATGLLKRVGGDDNFDFTYNPFEISSEDEYEKSRLYNISQTSDGFILSLDGLNESKGYGDDENVSGKMSFSYDSDGHIVSGRQKIYSSDGSPMGSAEMAFTWQDGLLMEYTTSMGGESLKVAFKYDSGNANRTAQFSSACFPSKRYFLFSECNSLNYAGFFGNGPVRFPVSAEVFETLEGDNGMYERKTSCTFEYTFNADGTVATSTVSTQGDGTAETETFTFKYEDDPTAGIGGIDAGGEAAFRMDGGNIVVKGAVSGKKVVVAGIDGKVVDANVSFADGEAVVHTSGLPSGAYIIRCGGAAFKFVKHSGQ